MLLRSKTSEKKVNIFIKKLIMISDDSKTVWFWFCAQHFVNINYSKINQSRNNK